MTLKKQVLRSLGWAAGAKGIGQIINWAMTLYVIRILSPEDYGLMALAMMFITVLLPIGELRLGSALVQQDFIDEAIQKKVFGLVLFTSGVLCLGLNLSATWIGSIFGTLELIPIVQVLSFSLIIVSLAVVPRAVLQRELDFKAQSIIDMAGAVSGGIIAATLASLGFGVWALVWSHFTNISIASLGLITVTRSWKMPDFDFRGLGRMIRFGGWMTMAHFTWLLASQVDVFIIGKLLGERTLGFYSVAKHIAQLPQSRLQGIINSVAFPAYSKARLSGSNPTYYLKKYMRLSSLVTFPVFAGLSCVAPQFVSLILGEKWEPAILPLQLLSLMLSLRVLEYAFAPYLDAMGKVKTSFWNMMLSLIIMIILLPIGATWGLAGVCIAWAVGVVATFLVSLFRSAQVTDISVPAVLGIVSKMIVPTGIMYGVVLFIQITAGNELGLIALLMAKIVVGAATFGICLWFLCRVECYEILELLRIKKPIVET